MKNFRCRLYMLVFLLIALFLCSCGGSSKPEQSGDISTNANVDVGIDLGNETASAGSNGTPVIDDNSNPIVVRVESQEEVYPFAEETFIKSIARVESTLLLLADEDNTGRLGLTEYTILEDGHPTISDVKELNIFPLPFEGEPIMYAVAAGNDGNFYLLAGNNINNASTILVVQRYNRAGEYIDCMEIPDWDLLTVDVFSVGSNGEFVLAVDDTICVYRWADGLLERHSGEFRVYSSSMSGAGLIVSTFSTVNHKGQYSLINCETGALENLSLSEDDPSGNTSMLLYRVCGSVASCQSLGEEYLMNQGTSICQVDFDNDTIEELIEWNPENNTSAEIGASCRLSDSAFACLLNGKLLFAWSHMVEKRESGIVRVAVIDGVASQNVARTVTRMNTADCPYIYEISVFDDNESGDMQRFRGELASGAYDLVVFHSEVNTESSNFEDLYPYIDADEELSRDSFLPNLLDSMSIHGELHQIWNSVSIRTMIARKDIVGDGRGLSIADCERLVSEHADIQSVLDNKFSDQNGLKQDTLLNISYLASTAFVDKNSATCSFDSEEFANLLSLCSRITANPDSNGVDFLLYTAGVSTADYLSKVEQRYGPCSYVGYPNGGDGIHYYCLPNDFEYSIASAIPANSLNKAGAWYFIKTMFSRSNQLKIANVNGTKIPVIYDIALEVAEDTASQEDLEEFLDLLERTKYAELYGDSTLREIIIDNSQAYLAGTKSLVETVQLIQSKASIYVAEQFG